MRSIQKLAAAVFLILFGYLIYQSMSSFSQDRSFPSASPVAVQPSPTLTERTTATSTATVTPEVVVVPFGSTPGGGAPPPTPTGEEVVVPYGSVTEGGNLV
ncbi:MAG: hypothetical protein M3220_12740, partial [Chloroflexota bacterium]|nr:hypothetical protein [Chloroflexota bacterium]